MIPESLLKFSFSQGVVTPHYLDERDYPWIRLLIQEYHRFVGRPKAELLRHLKGPLPFLSPYGKRALAIYTLGRIFRSEVSSPIAPRKLRASLFSKAALGFTDRNAVVAATAAQFSMSPETLESALFSDLPSEKLVTAPTEEASVSEVALKANCLLVQGFLARSLGVKIELEGNARLVVGQAKFRGLICQAKGEPGTGKISLTISGPFALFRRTLLYGKALGELVPPLIWCNRFRLVAKCIITEREHTVVVASGDPIFPSKAPKQFDSKVEASFSTDFMRLSKDWDLIREPEPVAVDGTLIFPDFLIRSRRDPAVSWFLEIVGFWTSDYLTKKIKRLKASNMKNLILCVNEIHNCANQDLPQGTEVVRYSKRIDPAKVLKLINQRGIDT